MRRMFVVAAALLLAACSSAPTPPRLVVAQHGEHLDELAREPMVAEHPNGTLFVAGYWPPTPALRRGRRLRAFTIAAARVISRSVRRASSRCASRRSQPRGTSTTRAST